MSKFGLRKVRCRLLSLKTLPVINEKRYSLLCERVAHVNPETKPQSHNILGVPAAGAILQGEGLLVCLNELALPLSMTAFFGVILLDLENDIKKRIFSAARSLMEQIGRPSITEIDDYHYHVIENPAAIDELTRIADTLRRLQREER